MNTPRVTPNSCGIRGRSGSAAVGTIHALPWDRGAHHENNPYRMRRTDSRNPLSRRLRRRSQRPTRFRRQRRDRGKRRDSRLRRHSRLGGHRRFSRHSGCGRRGRLRQSPRHRHGPIQPRPRRRPQRVPRRIHRVRLRNQRLRPRSVSRLLRQREHLPVAHQHARRPFDDLCRRTRRYRHPNGRRDAQLPGARRLPRRRQPDDDGPRRSQHRIA